MKDKLEWLLSMLKGATFEIIVGLLLLVSIIYSLFVTSEVILYQFKKYETVILKKEGDLVHPLILENEIVTPLSILLGLIEQIFQAKLQ